MGFLGDFLFPVAANQAKFGPYLILHKLGEGAMAKVYLARHTGDTAGKGRDVALKILRYEYSHQEEVLHLLTREAIIGQKMRHPNVVATLEFGELDGMPYLAMEYVPGVTVADLLEVTKEQRNGLPPELVAVLLEQICDGLSYAHNLSDSKGKNLGVIHRDLKPGNVMVSLNGVAKVMDFGVAKVKIFGGGVTTTSRTTRGTPAYMSPEQARGRSLSHHSDIFATGLLLYEMLTGKKPFKARNLNELIKMVQNAHLTGLEDDLDEIRPGLGRIFRRSTAAASEGRYPDASWLGEDIRQLYPPDTPIPPPLVERGDQTHYYNLDDTGSGDEAKPRPANEPPPPRMLTPEDEGDIEELAQQHFTMPKQRSEHSTESNPGSAQPVLASGDLEDVEDTDELDLDDVPELDLEEDEDILEVDLGPPSFLETNPQPDPQVPASSDTLHHLTQFLVEIES